MGRLKNSQGQVIVEYILSLVIVISVISLMSAGFNRILLGKDKRSGIWPTFVREITAACPNCPDPNEN